jgi:ornithine carbamoyltransferase
LVVLRPEGFSLPPAIMERVRNAAAAAGGSVTETSERAEALAVANIVYAKEWGCTTHYGDETADATLRRRYTDWCVRDDWFNTAAADCRLMHCLPVRRNVAVADAVLDGPRSAVLRQAHNRLTVQMAVLHRLFIH